MRKLLDFLVRKRHWFLFILLEIISLTLVYRNNAYQRNIMFSSANVITGHITSVSGFVTSYLNLRDINRELLERNGQLEMELLELQDQLEMMREDGILFRDRELFPPPDLWKAGGGRPARFWTTSRRISLLSLTSPILRFPR